MYGYILSLLLGICVNILAILVSVCHGEFDNGYGKVPWIRFDWEDRVLLADGSTIGTPAGSTQREFSDPGATLARLAAAMLETFSAKNP